MRFTPIIHLHLTQVVHSTCSPCLPSTSVCSYTHFPFNLTHTGGALYLFPLPAEYERVLLRKLAMTGELRQRFRQVSFMNVKGYQML